jgi:hypothetical protein
MSKGNQPNRSNEKRSYNSKDVDAKDKGTQLTARPRSLSMGPSVIFDYAAGDLDTAEIVESWRPRFRIVYQDTIEAREWEL